MVAVKIPGAESIEQVAPARDPGVQATPEDFGSQLGASQAHFGDTAMNAGATLLALTEHLKAKRQDATDQTYEQTYNVNVAPRLAQAEIDLKKKYPDGGQDYERAADDTYLNVHAGTKADLAAIGLTPSEKAATRVETSFSGRLMNLRVGAVVYNNNADIKKQTDQAALNVGSVASEVLAGNQDVDSAIKQVDGIMQGAKPLYGSTFDATKKAAREQVYDAAINNAIAGKDPTRARELSARFYGGTPQPGQSQADPLVRSESGGDPTLVNQLGYAGKYQFGAPRLEALGVYTPGPNENLDTWSKTPRDAPGKWSGTFNIDGFPQVKTLSDFLANPAAQQAVYSGHVEAMDEESTAHGLDKYVGQTVGGIPITRAGIRNMTHLGGIGGAERFLNSGGQDNVGDANRTRMSDYAKLGNQTADSPNVAKSLAFNNRIESMDAVNRADTTSAITDDLASVSATGIGDSSLTAERVTRSLGPNAAADWQTARVRAKTFHDQTQDFSTLPPEQINARLLALAPKPGQEEYAAQDALHTAAVNKADALMELRKKDPAESVSDDPEVKKATAAYDPNKPDTTKAIISARLAAQSRAGIFSPAPIPVDETQRLLKPITEAVQLEEASRTPKGQPNRIVLAQQQLVKDLKEKYGSYADDVMKEVIGQAASRRDRLDQATAAGEIMKSLINGTVPGAKPVKTVTVAAENKAAADASPVQFDPNPPPSMSFPAPPPTIKTPSAKSVQILLNAPAADQARLAGLFDKQFGAGAAAKLLNQKAAPTGTVTIDASGAESYTP